MLEKILETPWGSYPWPEWEKTIRVSEALHCIYAAKDEKSAETASSKLRWAVGNDERGSYYPALIGVLPFLDDVLRNGGRWPRWAVIGVLTDFFWSFGPEPGLEEFADSAGHRISVESEFKAWARNLRPLLSDIAQRRDETSDAARRLLEMIDEKSG